MGLRDGTCDVCGGPLDAEPTPPAEPVEMTPAIEWGIRWAPPEGSPFADAGRSGVQPIVDEETARVMVRFMSPLPGWTGAIVNRQVGPWKEAPDRDDGGNGHGRPGQ